MNGNERVSANVAAARRYRGLSQRQFAALMNEQDTSHTWSSVTVSFAENRRRRSFRWDARDILAAATVLDVPPARLLADPDLEPLTATVTVT